MSNEAANSRPRVAGRLKAELQAAAFDLAPSPALLLGPDGVSLGANAAAEALLGQALPLFGRLSLSEVLAGDAELPQIVAKARAGALPVRERDVAIHLPDRAPMQVEAVATPLPDGVVLLTLTQPDVPSAAERHVDLLRSAAGMGRTLAHEVKNPLAGIRGAAQLLQASASLEDVALAQLIVDETDRIRRLIDRVEAFSDERALELKPVNIHRVLDRVRALVAAAHGDPISFREAYDPSLPHVLGDEDQLIQVFLNLVKNAAEAVAARGDGRGEIRLATSYLHGVRPRGGGSPLEVVIQDNGPGVPAGLRDRLFDPFVTSKPHGVGLGLTLVAKLVAAHDGRIAFESEPGRTVFRVHLPVEGGASRPRPKP